jgi:hypothetical protein
MNTFFTTDAHKTSVYCVHYCLASTSLAVSAAVCFLQLNKNEASFAPANAGELVVDRVQREREEESQKRFCCAARMFRVWLRFTTYAISILNKKKKRKKRSSCMNCRYANRHIYDTVIKGGLVLQQQKESNENHRERKRDIEKKKKQKREVRYGYERIRVSVEGEIRTRWG